MTGDDDWIPTAVRKPRPDQRVDWLAPSGCLVSGGTYRSGLWFFPAENPMYAYSTPVFRTAVFWRPARGVT